MEASLSLVAWGDCKEVVRSDALEVRRSAFLECPRQESNLEPSD